MGMNIKNSHVHAMARELANLRGISVTNAVGQALRAELERSRKTAPGQEDLARQQVLMQLLSRCKDLPWPNQRNSNELQAELYNEVGLPA